MTLLLSLSYVILKAKICYKKEGLDLIFLFYFIKNKKDCRVTKPTVIKLGIKKIEETSYKQMIFKSHLLHFYSIANVILSQWY